MGCNCKGQTIDTMSQGTVKSNLPTGQTILKYVLKTFAFVLFLLALPIINIYIIYMAFNMLVMNKNIDIKPLLLSIGNKFKKVESDYIDVDEYDNYTENDVILTNVENITPKTKSK